MAFHAAGGLDVQEMEQTRKSGFGLNATQNSKRLDNSMRMSK